MIVIPKRCFRCSIVVEGANDDDAHSVKGGCATLCLPLQSL